MQISTGIQKDPPEDHFTRGTAFSPLPEQRPLFARLRVGIGLLYALAIVAAIIAQVAIAVADYRTTVREMQRQSSSLARSLHEHLARSMVSVEQAMQNLAEDFERAGGVDKIAEAVSHQRMADRIKLTPQIRGIIAIDENGILSAHGLEYPVRRIDLSDRTYFPYHRDHKDFSLRIGEPIVSRTDYKWLIPLTLRINRADGSFAGVMLSGVEPDYFLRFYESLKLPAGDRIQLVRNDGTILLTFPLDIAALGAKLDSVTTESKTSLQQTGESLYRVTDALGEERFVTQLAVAGNPVIVQISSSARTGLAKFWHDTLLRALTSIAFIALLSALLYLLLRQIGRVEAVEAELRRHGDLLQNRAEERTSEIMTLLNANPLAIALVEGERIRFVNPAFENLFSYSAQDLIGQHEGIIHGSSESLHALHGAIVRKTLAGDTYRGESEFFRSDASSFWATVFARAVHPGEPDRGIILIIEDITAQRASALALRQSERIKRTVLESTGDGFALINAQRVFVEANPAFLKHVGMQSAALIGRTPEALWGEIGALLFPLFPSETTQQTSVEITLPGDDGSMKPFRANTGVVCDEYGNLEYCFVFLLDISRQKEFEHTLFDAKNSAEIANAAKSAFLANISHELRTPMHAILSFSEMGLQRTDDANSGETVKRFFQRIQSSGQRLLSLINDLFDMSRLEANRMSYQKTLTFLRDTVNHAVAAVTPQLANKHLRLEITGTRDSIVAEYDNARISQVIVNLLSNAIRYSPEGGVVSIDLFDNARLPDDVRAIGVSVWNQGPGIPEDELEKIFETFQQNPVAADNAGLSLAISRRVLRDHDGDIRVVNDPRGGLLFTVLLPAQRLSPPVRASHETEME